MYYLILDKLKGHPLAFIGLAMLLVFTYNLLSLVGLPIAILFSGFFMAIILLVIIYKQPLTAILIHLFCSFLMFFIFYRLLKVKSIPLGFLLDGLNLLAIIVLLLKKQLKGFNTEIGILLLVWFALTFIEVINPNATSRVAWIQSMRQIFNSIAPFFIFYSLFKTRQNILRPFFHIWIALSVFAAIYTLYQEFVGLPQWDYDHIHKDEMRKELYYTFGRLRKIAFLDNPTENGIILCVNFVLCFGLAFRDNLKIRHQVWYMILAILSVWGMIYTGTRTATVLFVIGVGMYVVLRRKKILWLGCVFVGVLLTGYIVQSGGGAAVSVMKTAFDADEDPSMMVRFHNQKILRSYLYRSPIGYGMGSTGYLGEKYAPHTFLGSFPPDSELVRIIIEVGFLGLIFYLYMYYVYLKKASNLLLISTQNDFTRNFRMITVVLLFVIIIGHYPQEIMGSNSFKDLVAFLLAYISLSSEDSEYQFL